MLPAAVHVYPVCIRQFADDHLLELSRKLLWKGHLRLGTLHTYCMWISLLGGIARKFSHLITWPGASAFGGAIMLGAAVTLVIAIALSATSALVVPIALSTADMFPVAGALDPLGACAFIGTCTQDVLVGHQGGLWTLQGLIGVPCFAHTIRPLSFPTLSGMESGLATQAFPQLGGGMSGLGTP